MLMFDSIDTIMLITLTAQSFAIEDGKYEEVSLWIKLAMQFKKRLI